MEKIKIVLSDYQKRLTTVKSMIDDIEIQDDTNPTYVRLATKASNYRTFISELEKAIK